jgi:hypothetical protein
MSMRLRFAMADIPAEVRERITAFYLQGLGREPTVGDLVALLAFARAWAFN